MVHRVPLWATDRATPLFAEDAVNLVGGFRNLRRRRKDRGLFGLGLGLRDPGLHNDQEFGFPPPPLKVLLENGLHGIFSMIAVTRLWSSS